MMLWAHERYADEMRELGSAVIDGTGEAKDLLRFAELDRVSRERLGIEAGSVPGADYDPPVDMTVDSADLDAAIPRFYGTFGPEDISMDEARTLIRCGFENGGKGLSCLLSPDAEDYWASCLIEETDIARLKDGLAEARAALASRGREIADAPEDVSAGMDGRSIVD